MKITRRLFPFTLSLDLSKRSLGTAIMTPPVKVRVASYNVLSSHLADPRDFPTLNPDHLSSANRFPVVLQKLQEEVDQNSIICLQEVSYDWAGSLFTYFANRGYHLVTGLYGKKHHGYMGVALAWPINQWRVIDVDISRLTDKREGGWPKAPSSDPGRLTEIWNQLARATRPYLEYVGIVSKGPVDTWEMAENRFNVLLTVKLQDKTSGRSFAIGTYHMPCAYKTPKVMTIHTDLAARHVQRLAGSMPFILAGDWNIAPSDSSYRLLTTGKMDVGDPVWPEPKYGMHWEPTTKAMRSAYAASDHGEPEFTNYARWKDEDPYIDTLDYIFISPQWTVKGVKPLPHKAEAAGPFPNLDYGEPSDHILIAAELILN